jgi:hypothetical protein
MSLRDDLIEVLAEELEADCDPVVALDTVLDYLEANVDEWGSAASDMAPRSNGDLMRIAALRIQENQ